MNNDTLYIVPTQKTKPIKIVYEDLPCPILLNLREEFRCKHAKSKIEDLNWILHCSADKCEHIVIENV